MYLKDIIRGDIYMKKTNKKYIVICVAVILIIAIMVIYEITGNKNNSSQTDKSEYSVSTTDNEKNNADNFISDNKETQIRDDYAEIYDYEYQGNYARVKFKDGYWGIVNKNGKVIFDGADYIEKLPTVTALCSAVKNGHAIIFYLDIDSDSVQVIKSFDEYVNISEVYFECFAIVQDIDGYYGVINADGDEVIPVKYKEVNYKVLESDNWFGSHILFRLNSENGEEFKEINF